MALEGPDFYEQEELFATYIAKRAQADSANETLEKPIFDQLTGDLAGLRLLDLGCGDGRYGQEAMEAGCQSYLGLEGSRRMANLAKANLGPSKLAGTKAQIVQARIQEWSYPPRQFDLATSRLVLHYVEEIDGLLAKIYQTLIEGGRFVFSVEHPVITSSDRTWQSGGRRGEWIVDNYFQTGRRVTTWMGGQVVKYHRTIEDYWHALRRAGFAVDELRESRPLRANFADEETYQRRKRIPLMLFFSASRPRRA